MLRVLCWRRYHAARAVLGLQELGSVAPRGSAASTPQVIDRQAHGRAPCAVLLLRSAD